jgi:hypothetical protein
MKATFKHIHLKKPMVFCVGKKAKAKQYDVVESMWYK